MGTMHGSIKVKFFLHYHQNVVKNCNDEANKFSSNSSHAAFLGFQLFDMFV